MSPRSFPLLFSGCVYGESMDESFVTMMLSADFMTLCLCGVPRQ